VEEHSTPLISVIVPCLNERRAIDQIMARLFACKVDLEIIVVDGGSTDGTLERLSDPRIRLLQTRKGRGHQLDFGARAAKGVMLWFLHADTLIAPEAVEELRRVTDDPLIKSGNFQLMFDGDSSAAKTMTWIYRHLRLIGLCYGDSAYFVRADTYQAVGGFRDFPIFEDLDLLRRLRKAGPTTSSRRFEGRSFVSTFAYWTFLQTLYWLGCDPGG
jgi:rSAM/selenodomain-associated transferase 2